MSMNRRSADAARELQVAHVAHQRDVGVVDRERQLRLIVERRRQVLPGLRISAIGGFASGSAPAEQRRIRAGPRQQNDAGDGRDGENGVRTSETAP